MKQKVCILGSTGSIGTQTLDVVRRHADKFEVVGLSASGKNLDLLVSQIEEFSPEVVATVEDVNLPVGVNHLKGKGANEKLIWEVEADIYVVALSGTSGIAPTYSAVSTGKRVALANKESLVSAGKFILERCRTFGSEIIPVDSEHSAIFQCLLGQDRDALKRVILTASGGPFLRKPLEELDRITPEEALSHPVWNMGPKITVDSATMMNKGLEVIEARWLFSLSPREISVLVHPQGVVHSMVEFKDGSVLAQMGTADMRIPISFALGFPQRIESGADFLELAGKGLTFEDPDPERFPLLFLAYKALEDETVLPVILNTANEVAVKAFLEGKIKFTGISRVVEICMEKFSGGEVVSIEDVLDLHYRTIEEAERIISEGLS